MPSSQESERNRGFLTKDDRLYLLGYADIEPQSDKERDTRRRIRERTTDAILDFWYLIEHEDDERAEGLEERDRERIFAPEPEIKNMFDEALAELIAFLYLGSVGRVPNFETILKRGVRRAEHVMAKSDDLAVDVDFDVHRTAAHEMDWESVADRIRRGKWNTLSEEEMRLYLRFYAKSGEFDPDRPGEYVHDQLAEFQERAGEAIESRQRAARESQKTKQDYRNDDRTNSE